MYVPLPEAQLRECACPAHMDAAQEVGLRQRFLVTLAWKPLLVPTWLEVSTRKRDRQVICRHCQNRSQFCFCVPRDNLDIILTYLSSLPR